MTKWCHTHTMCAVGTSMYYARDCTVAVVVADDDDDDRVVLCSTIKKKGKAIQN